MLTVSGVDTGRWSCLGKPVAKMELNKIFVEVRSTQWPQYPTRESFLTTTDSSSADSTLR